jgi:membrane protease subunit HflK
MSDKKFKNPWGDDQNDLNDIIRKGQEKIIQLFGDKGKDGGGGGNFFNGDNFGFNLNKNLVLIVLAVIAVMWLSTGFYTVQPDQEGVVMRFGKYTRTASPGLNYKLPSPIERVIQISVTRINKEEIGFRSAGKSFTSKQQLLQSTVGPESQMLTTDQNIVEINFQVQWLISDAKKFLFNVRDNKDENTVKNVAESAMREVIGLATVVEVLAEERSKIEQSTKKLIQDMLDNYEMGVKVVGVQLLRSDPPQEVLEAYRDVQNAKQDQEREINTAQAYRNDIVPRARGEGEKMLLDAEAYKSKVVADAQGDAKRFNSIYDQYKNAKDVTRKRLYIETMEEVLANMDKIIVDKGASNLVPYLPLSEINKNKENAGK